MTTFEIDRQFDLDSGSSVRVRFDKAIGSRATTYHEALVAAREIPQAAAITALDKSVMLLVSTGIFNAETAVRVVRGEAQRMNIAALNDALTAAMFSDNFTTKITPNGTVVSLNVPGIEIAPDFFDDKETNMERLTSGLPPLPLRNPKHPIEQRHGLIMALFSAYPALNVMFNNVFENAVTALVQAAFQQGVGEVDVDGFRSGNMGGNPDEQNKPAGKVTRRRNNRQ